MIKNCFIIFSLISANEAIINGNYANLLQFPYYAQLSITINGLTGLCGGSLINKLWIVTAAHCTKNASSIWIGLGCHNAATCEFTTNSKSIITHADFKGPAMENDIGLVSMMEEPHLSKFVKPIRLLPKNYAEDLVSYRVFLSGLGIVSDEKKWKSSSLLWMTLEIVPIQKCKDAYGFNFKEKLLICAKPLNKNQNLCGGDSGGGLVMRKSSINYLVGVASFGKKKYCKGAPAGFVRISNYLDWINEHIK